MSSGHDDRQQLIERLVERTLDAATGDRRAVVEPFVHHCCVDLSHEDLTGVDAAELAGAILSLLELAGRRRPGELKLRVMNPAPAGGAAGGPTVIQSVTDDMRFLVDSVTGEINRRELAVHLVTHPQMAVRRDAGGTLLEVAGDGEAVAGMVEESLVHIEIDRLGSAALAELETALRQVLTDVRTAVEDWQPMRDAAGAVLAELESSPPPLAAEVVDETCAFMRWVVGDHFTFLGYLEYRLADAGGEDQVLRPVPETGLGLLRSETAAGQPSISGPVAAFDGGRLMTISKTGRKSTVHRNVHMDLIRVRRFDGGEPAGEFRLLGLFTSMAYSITASEIPLVRQKVERVIERTGFASVSHNAKVLRHIVEHYPRDELFQIAEDDLYRFALRILELQLRPQLALLVRRDDENRFVYCLVFVPRERHSTQLRERMQAILEEAFGGEVTANDTRITEQPLAQLLFTVRVPETSRASDDVATIEARLADVVRSWSDRLKQVLAEAGGWETGLKTWRRYREAFPAGYQDLVPATEAAQDVAAIDEVLQTGKLGMRLYRRPGAAVTRFRFRTFELATPAPLSSFLPMLENMGFTVSTEIPFEVRPAAADNPVWIRDFELIARDLDAEPDGVRERFEDAFARVWDGQVENDGFNRLVLRAGLDWRQVVVLRAYYRYLRQIGFTASQSYVARTLSSYPEIARLLVRLFETHFDPAAGAPAAGAPAAGVPAAGVPEGEEGDRDARAAEVVRQIQHALEGVSSLDEDRILWRFLNLIQSTLRTNCFQTSVVGRAKEYLSFKLDSRRVRDLPAPRPMFEIFVYSPWVEAVHLRGGKVARGGIRWSDRLEDFRKEILGLVKSQMVKNAVIVPVGAKGGFVVRRPKGDRDAAFEEGVDCYKTMIRGMLDLTDNLRGSQVVPPPDVVRRDGDDPYLVVAADKGTAKFSDIANGIAAEYDRLLVEEDLQPLGEELRQRLEQTVQVLLKVTGHEHLLEENPVLRRSIATAEL